MPYPDLVQSWNRAGISNGDTVLLHSNTLRTALQLTKQGLRPTMSDLLQTFIDAVGPDGTLLLPLFNFGFPRGVAFDMNATPSHMGALTEAARKHPQAIRTGHPIYSFAAIGRHAHRFSRVDNFSGYGPDSPFGMLRELDGKIAALDLSDQACMTFYHHVEEMCSAPYRYHKVFEGQYTCAEGHTSVRRYGLFVRDLERGVTTAVDPAGDLMWQQGLYRGDRPGVGTGLRVVNANAMFAFVAEILASARALGLLYRLDNPQ